MTRILLAVAVMVAGCGEQYNYRVTSDDGTCIKVQAWDFATTDKGLLVRSAPFDGQRVLVTGRRWTIERLD